MKPAKITAKVERLPECPKCGKVGMSDGVEPCWPCQNGV